ncbi:MAG: S41 family peptidase [Defluviitaleaceae bacterium]|nr:S41 family peptidase [Defluviitaleaceae bacterium]
MAIYKKITILIFAALISAVLLISCTAETENYAADYAYIYEEDEVKEEQYYATIPQRVFTGEPIHRDNLHFPQGRDREWEEDIRHFATMAFRHHPLLVGYDNISHIEGIASRDYSHFAYSVLLKRAAAKNGILSDNELEINEALRKIFLDRVNALILNIPHLNDFEIKYSLSEIAAVLDDLHTNISPGLAMAGDFFPVELLFLYDGIYFIGVPSASLNFNINAKIEFKVAPNEIKYILYGELLAIDGMPTDEVIRRLARVLPHENEYKLRQSGLGLQSFLIIRQLLSYINAVDDSGAAIFTIRNKNGEIVDVQIEAIPIDAAINMRDTQFIRHEFSTLRHGGEIFSYEYFPEDSIMYVRIHRFVRSEEVITVMNKLREELRNRPPDEKIDKLIIDLRGNPGGHTTWPSDADFPVLAEAAESLYVIIDGGSLSQSVIVTSHLMNRMENLTIAGEPSGQAENFFFGGNPGHLPNSGLTFMVSRGMNVHSNSTDAAIRPDVFIPLTIDDVINNRDPVLDFIWGR